MVYRLVPFKKEHITLLEMRETVESYSVRAFDEDIREHFTVCEQRGLGYTLICDGVPVAAAGVIAAGPGVGDAWMIGTIHLRKYGRLAALLARKGLDDIVAALALHRVQAYVVEGHAEGRRFAEFLGMKEEGVAIAYDEQRRNYVSYARIW